MSFHSRNDNVVRTLIDLARSQVDTLTRDSTNEDFYKVGYKLKAILTLTEGMPVPNGKIREMLERVSNGFAVRSSAKQDFNSERTAFIWSIMD